MTDLEKAKDTLKSGEYTCVLVKDSRVYTSSQRGVQPLVDWKNSVVSLCGFSAADKVVGKATAFIYALLGIEAVYARIISQSALAVLSAYGIMVEYGEEVPNIINRRGDGICPFEAAVLDISDKNEAWARILEKMDTYNKKTAGT